MGVRLGMVQGYGFRFNEGEELPDVECEQLLQEVLHRAATEYAREDYAICGPRSHRFVATLPDSQAVAKFDISALDDSGYSNPADRGVLFPTERLNDDITYSIYETCLGRFESQRLFELTRNLYPEVGCYVNPDDTLAVEDALRWVVTHSLWSEDSKIATVGGKRTVVFERRCVRDVASHKFVDGASLVPCPSILAAVAADMLFGAGASLRLRPYLNVYWA